MAAGYTPVLRIFVDYLFPDGTEASYVDFNLVLNGADVATDFHVYFCTALPILGFELYANATAAAAKPVVRQVVIRNRYYQSP